MSATPASRPMALATAEKSRSRAKTSVTSDTRSMKTNERILRNASCNACSTDRKNTEALVTLVETSQRTKISGRRGRVGRNLSSTGTPPVLSEARIVRRTSTWARRLRPLSSWPCVASRRLSWATTRWTAARSWSGPLGSARSRSDSGRDGGSCRVRSMRSRSSSRRRCCSKRRMASRGSPSRRGSPSGLSGCGSARSSSERRIRCTSTPMTPEPSPWRPKAAIARRARARMAPSDPSRSAAATCWRSVSRLTSSESSWAPPSPLSCSLTPWRTASISGARKKNFSKTKANIRRSSGDLANVAESASRKSRWSVQPTSESAAKPSSSSEVPMATPSSRSSSAKRRSCASNPWLGAGKLPELHADALGDHVEVGAVLDDHRHGLLERRPVEVLGAQEEQCPRPVDRFGDRRRLLQVELPDHADDLDEPAGHRLGQLGRVQADDLQLVLDLRVVEPEVEAAPLQRLGQLAGVVRGEEHDGHRLRLDPPELGDRDLEVGQQLEQHRLELLVGLVDLVDQQHDRLGRGDRRHERAGEQEVLAEDVVLELAPCVLALRGLDAQELLAVVPLVQGLGLVEALVALEPHEAAVQVLREGLGELGLADAGGSLDEHGLAELGGEIRDQRGRLAREVADGAQAVGDLADGPGCDAHAAEDTG